MPIDVRRAALAGVTAWWFNSVLGHCTAPDDAARALSGTVAEPGDRPAPLIAVVGRLRSRGLGHVSLVLPEPGDPVGLPGPAPVTRAAVAAGAALVAGDGSLVLVPGAGNRWTQYPAVAGADPAARLGSLGEAWTLARESMLTVRRNMTALEPDARAIAELASFRAFEAPVPPPGIPPRAGQVADSALRVWWLTEIAAGVCERGERPLPDALRALRPAARRAASVAFSTTPAVGTVGQP